MKQRYIINQESKSYLANLLATENLEVQYRKTQTASFDVKNRILTIPIWKKDLSEPVTDLFVAHEVGHALYTPVALLEKAHKEKINHSIVNVVEDARIEKLIKRRYNGLRQSFIRGYKELIAKDFFGTAQKDINKMLLIDRLNIHFKSSHITSNVKFTDKEMKFVKMMEDLETTEDVIKVSKILQKYCNMEREEKGIDQQISFDDHEANFEKVNPNDIPQEIKDEVERKLEELENQESDSEDSDDENGDESKSTQEDEDKKEEDDSDPISAGVKGRNTDNLDQAVAETDRNWERMKENILDKDAEDNEYAYIHNFKNFDNIIVDYKTVISQFRKYNAHRMGEYDNTKPYYSHNPESWKKSLIASRQEYKKFNKKSLKTVMYLVKEFEMKKSAALYARASSDRTGVVDPLKLHSYKYADDIFKKLTILPDGKNHGLMLLLDWSGSMYDKILPTVEQLINLTMFCRKINVPFEVYAFANSNSGRYYNDGEPLVNYRLGDAELDQSFKLINWASSRMNNKDFEENMCNLFILANIIGSRYNRRGYDYEEDSFDGLDYPQEYGMASTPLNDAIMTFHTLIPQFVKKYSIEKMNTILLTDGHSDRGLNRWDPTPKEWGYRSKRPVLVSRKTKKQYHLQSNSSEGFTTALLNNLRVETGTKVIGFFLQSRKSLDMWNFHKTHGKLDVDSYGNRSRYVSGKDQEIIRKEWRKNKCVVTERAKHNTPYDEHYTINSNSMKISDEEMATPSENAKTGELKRLFAKSRTGSLQSRVVLNRFVKLVA
tara:strand:+ start:148 stop:2475 length:2328 start_codon:yes stop_codon:yes gene_type:complete